VDRQECQQNWCGPTNYLGRHSHAAIEVNLVYHPITSPLVPLGHTTAANAARVHHATRWRGSLAVRGACGDGSVRRPLTFSARPITVFHIGAETLRPPPIFRRYLRGGFKICCLGGQLIEKALGPLQVAGVEAFGEPAVERSKKIAGLIPPALIAPDPRHAHRRAQFPVLCLLFTSNRKRTLET